MITLVALAAASLHRSDPYSRFTAFSVKHPTFLAKFSTVSASGSSLTGSFLVQRPRRMLFKCNYDRTNYSASCTEKGYVEINQADKIYDENPATPNVRLYLSRITSAIEESPSVVLLSDIRKYMPPKSTITATKDGDSIYGVGNSPSGETDIWVSINREGEVTDFRVKTPGKDQRWKISYSFPKSLSLANFLTPLPNGFQPYALARNPMPLQKGKAFPCEGWVKSGSSVQQNLFNLSGHRAFLFAILDNDGPSQRSKQSLRNLSGKLPVLIAGPGGLKDPSGSLMSAINPPGTPSFFLVDSSGKILRLWFGFDPSNAAGFESDVLTSLNR